MMCNISQHCVFIIGHAVVRLAKKGRGGPKQWYRRLTESTKHAADNKSYKKHKYSEGNGYSLKRGKWGSNTG